VEVATGKNKRSPFGEDLLEEAEKLIFAFSFSSFSFWPFQFSVNFQLHPDL